MIDKELSIENIIKVKKKLSPFVIKTHDGGTELFRVKGSGLTTFTNNISGSSTSTGSFGVLKLANYNAGYGNQNNTYYGQRAGDSVTSGQQNVLLGKDSGTALTTGGSNTFLGSEAGYNTVDMDRAVLIGKNAGFAGNMTSDADGLIGIGYDAARNISTGRYNVAIGYEALYTATELDRNTAIGYQALKVLSGSAGYGDNTAVGYQTGVAMTSGYENTLVGKSSGASLTTGIQNVAVGVGTLDAENT